MQTVKLIKNGIKKKEVKENRSCVCIPVPQ